MDTDERGGPSACAIAGGMEENTLYLFDAEAVLSASHTIEELNTKLPEFIEYRGKDPAA